jgi:hypothetical protein
MRMKNGSPFPSLIRRGEERLAARVILYPPRQFLVGKRIP